MASSAGSDSRRRTAELARAHAAVYRALAEICAKDAGKLAASDTFASLVIPRLDDVQQATLAVEQERWKHLDARAASGVEAVLANLGAQAAAARDACTEPL